MSDPRGVEIARGRRADSIRPVVAWDRVIYRWPRGSTSSAFSTPPSGATNTASCCRSEPRPFSFKYFRLADNCVHKLMGLCARRRRIRSVEPSRSDGQREGVTESGRRRRRLPAVYIASCPLYPRSNSRIGGARSRPASRHDGPLPHSQTKPAVVSSTPNGSVWNRSTVDAAERNSTGRALGEVHSTATVEERLVRGRGSSRLLRGTCSGLSAMSPTSA
jgi:hypothetical protein